MNIYRQIINSVLAGQRLSWDVLRQCPEFDALYGNEENQKYHREGSTDKHIDLMLDILFGEFKTLTSRDFIIVYLSILWHDAFKPQSKSIGNNGLIHNYGHERLASAYFVDFLHKAYEKNTKSLYEYQDIWLPVINICHWHMQKNLDFYATSRAKYCLGNLKFYEEAFSALLHIDNFGAIGPADKPTQKDYLQAFKFLKYESCAPSIQSVNPYLTICIGASGSGKSTYAKKFAEDSHGVYINTDQIREELLGDIQDQSQNGRIFDEARKRVQNYLSRKSGVVFDATNITYKDRKGFIEIANRLQCPIRANVFLTPLSQCIERQQHRERKVPEEIIKRQYERMEPPSLFEFHAITTWF